MGEYKRSHTSEDGPYIKVPMYGSSSDVWTAFRYMPYIGTLAIHTMELRCMDCPYIGTRAIHTSECCPYIGGWSLWLLHHTLELRCMDGPYIRILAIHTLEVHTSEELGCIYVQRSNVWIAPMYGPSDGHGRGCFSGCRCANVWIRLFPPQFSLLTIFLL